MAHDRGALTRHQAEAVELLRNWDQLGTDPGGRARAAVALHNWYTGLESLFERVLRHIDQEVPKGDTSHRDILFQAAGELPGVRPFVVSPAAIDDLLELMAFRHFFRHAYAVYFDSSRLGALLRRLVEVTPAVDAGLEAFDTFLQQVLNQAGS